jgi:hypothetical protein
MLLATTYEIDFLTFLYPNYINWRVYVLTDDPTSYD